MKIAFIVTEFPTLSETFILSQIIGLLNMGHNVEIFAHYNPKEQKVHAEVDKYKLMERVHFFNIPKNKLLRFLKTIYLSIINFYKGPFQILKFFVIFKYRNASTLYVLIHFLNKNFDIIHCHYGPNGILGVNLKELGIRGKIVTTFHGFDLSRVISTQNNVYQKLFLKGDLFLPISDYWKRELITLGCDEKKITVHHMGINLNKIKYTQKNIQPGGPIKILTIGRLVEKKGHQYAIQAVAKLSSTYKDIIYIIVGDGPYRNKLETLVSDLRMQNNIQFLGSIGQDEVLTLYQQAHIFLLSSVTASNGDQEGIPIVLMEAQAKGLPIVSTYHSGIPEVVLDRKSGFLVPERDIDALAEKIEYLIEHPELWPEMAKCGRRFVEQGYDITKLNNRLVEIYKKTIEGK